MPSTQPSDLNPQVSLNSPKRIWIVNPFDQLPSETDVPLRYWALCRTFAQQGHEVIWWSSDFSHLTKSKRAPCPDTDGFSVRLIETPPYTKNISIARLKNHKAFADGFYHDAMVGLKSGELKAPDRIVVSLPPLGIAEQAFRIRDALRKCESKKVGKYEGQYQGRSRVALAPDSNEEKDTANRALKQPCYPDQSSVISHRSCQVVVDIMDAWPETFYQALPKPLRKILGPILVAPLHRSAKRAYRGADKISAVGQSYLDLASRYLGKKWKVEKSESGKGGNQRSDQSSTISHQSSPAKPMVLCYHGTDLDRFAQNKGGTPSVSSGMLSPNQQQATNTPAPLRAVYLGSMGSVYDLETIIEVAARWKAEGDFPFQIHFAGDGPQREALEARATQLGLTSTQSSVINHQSSKQPSKLASSARIVFHGFLQKNAITDLLLSADLALVPNRPDSLVACPYKAGEYAAAGLPMVSCLGGELGDLLKQWNAGCEYNEGDAASLQAAFEKYSTDSNLLKQQSFNARKMAEALFDRKHSYAGLAAFIIKTDSP